MIIPLNAGWFLTDGFKTTWTHTDWNIHSDAADALAGTRWIPVTIPHPHRQVPLNGFDEEELATVTTWGRTVRLPPEATQVYGPQMRAFLEFTAVMTCCDVYLSGRHLGSHAGGYTPFSFEVTGLLSSTADAPLVLRVDSAEHPGVPPFGHVVDYLCWGGIYRDVRLRLCGPATLAEIHPRPLRHDDGTKTLEVQVTVDRGIQGNTDLGIRGVLCTGNREIAAAEQTLLPADAENRITLQFPDLAEIADWDTENPVLYNLEIQLEQNGIRSDSRGCRIGFRSARFTADGFYLNGTRRVLIGLNRHQSWPWAGYAMPARVQRRDAEILKNELGLSIVRSSHYPASEDFLDACDELGLLVFEELPGWQHIGDTGWQDIACHDLEQMIRRDRHRPSVVLWGTRINESADHHEFYTRTAQIARTLDPDRQTGGVRNFAGSELLEDVYTFNDFTHDGKTGPGDIIACPGRTSRQKRRTPGNQTGPDAAPPYLISEHTGHMYPTKSFDNEQRLTEHALRHAQVLNAALGNPRISAVIGWCAFDYHTHRDFGSGDRICYHGVMDMFRMPKYAAFVYASQKPPASGIVMEAASIFAKGERDAARLLPIQVWTNCDSVVLYRGERRVGEFFPDRKTFPALPYPPVVIDDLAGETLADTGYAPWAQKALRRLAAAVFSAGLGSLGIRGTLATALVMLRYRLSPNDLYRLLADRVAGWGQKDESFTLIGMLAGTEAARRMYGGAAHASALEVVSDDAELHAGTSRLDATRVRIRAVDRNGNTQPFTAEALTVSVSGPGRLIGIQSPAVLPLTGGVLALWVAATGTPGEITVSIHSQRFGDQSVNIQVS